MIQIHEALRRGSVLENVEPLGVFSNKTIVGLELSGAQAAYAQSVPLVIRPIFPEEEEEQQQQRDNPPPTGLVIRIDLTRTEKFTFQYPVEGPVQMYTNARDVLSHMTDGAGATLSVDPWRVLHVVAIAPQRYGGVCVELDAPVPLGDVFPDGVKSGDRFNAGLVACAASYIPPRVLRENRELAQRMIAMAYNSGISLTACSKHLCDFIVSSPGVAKSLRERSTSTPPDAPAPPPPEESEE
jgi:hypothetical protein